MVRKQVAAYILLGQKLRLYSIHVMNNCCTKNQLPRSSDSEVQEMPNSNMEHSSASLEVKQLLNVSRPICI